MRQETKLRKISKEVKYEIDMFRNVSEILLKSNKLNQIEKNVFLESWVVHAYYLYQFFYQGKKKRIDDVIAEDFSLNKSYFGQNRVPKKGLKTIVKKRDKQVAHLTYNRIHRNFKTKGWPIPTLTNKMNKTIQTFFLSLSEQDRVMFENMG